MKTMVYWCDFGKLKKTTIFSSFSEKKYDRKDYGVDDEIHGILMKNQRNMPTE